MLPPTLSLSTDHSEIPIESIQFIADPESLRRQRRPSTVRRVRRTLDTITESVTSRRLTGFLDGSARFFDGNIVDVRYAFRKH